MALTESRTIEQGGLTALLVPRQLNKKGLAVAAGVSVVAGLGQVSVEGHSRTQYGRISYSDGMARMTNSYNSGAVQAMHRASGGNYGDFSAMAQRVVKTPGLMGGLTDTGATPQMISALYHMGGQ